MKLFKKILITLVAICLFIAATVGFTKMLRDFRVSETEEPQRNMEAYPRPIAATTEAPFTLPVDTAAETSAPETAVPETAAEEASVPETTVPETTVPETVIPETTAATEEPTEAPTEPPVTETLPPETLPEETLTEETQPRMDLSSVPLLYMSDYPQVRCFTGSLATSGSHVASLSMVASYLTGHQYWPDAMMEYFADYIGNSVQWLEYASDQLQLPWEKADNFHDARRALEEGKIVITVMRERSFYTESIHFVVLTGINEEGLITLHDPLESHYKHWNLGKMLENGFEDSFLIGGYQGGWIYDPEAMGEYPFIYQSQENPDEFRYTGVELTEAETDLMAKILWLEVRDQPFEGQQAMAEVILNRLMSPDFPDNIRSIINAQDQFRGANQLYKAKPTHTQYAAVRRGLKGPYVLSMDDVYFTAYSTG